MLREIFQRRRHTRRALEPAPVTPDPPATLIVVASRLPYERVREESGEYHWRSAPGGLVSAMRPALADSNAMWIGWGGGYTDETEGIEPLPDELGFRLEEVLLEREFADDYYEGFCNSALWPLYHNAVVTPAFHRHHFEAYHRVNERFADTIARVAGPSDTVWIHDYQLQLVPRLLRQRRPDLRIGFFLHIPFPPTEIFAQLPWRRQVLEGLLGADLIGFQTKSAAANFLALAGGLLGMRVSGDTVEVCDLPRTRQCRAQAFPVGIDAAAFSEAADDIAMQQRAKQIRVDLGSPTTLVLGVDRLDYTKGIDVRIRAFAEFVASLPDEGRDTILLQVATPSRDGVTEYQRIRDDVELLVGRINGDLGTTDYRPIHYLHQHFQFDELVAMYLAADIMLVTPLSDGMNLVAKEFIACRNEEDGALVLSEFTGAAEQLRDAWLVNPFDFEGLKLALTQAASASPAEKAERMRRLRECVLREDVRLWFDSFIRALERES